MRSLKSYPDAVTAHLARNLLKRESIDAFVADEDSAAVIPPVVLASGGVRLMVSEEDFDVACTIMRNAESGLGLPDDFDPGAPNSG